MRPEQLENRWLTMEQKLVDKAMDFGEMGRWIFIALLAAVHFYIFMPLWAVSFPEWARTGLATERLPMSLILIGASLLSPWLRHPAYNAFALTVGWAYFSYSDQFMSPWVLSFPAFFLFGWIILRLVLANPSPFKRWSGAVGLALLFIVCMYAAGQAHLDGGHAYLQKFWLIHPEYSLVALISLALSMPKRSDQPWNLSLFPSQALLPLPLPIQSRLERSSRQAASKIWWQGILNVVQAELLVALAMGIALVPLSESTFMSTAHKYLYFCVYVSASMNFAVGLLRIFGLVAPDASRFILLADSPMEVWRRGSVYVYQMILNLLFLPLMRLTRSLWLTIVLALTFILTQMFFFHEIGVQNFYAKYFPEMNVAFSGASLVIEGALRFAGGWLALIVLHRLALKGLPPKLRVPGQRWSMVLINQLLVVLLMMFLTQ